MSEKTHLQSPSELRNSTEAGVVRALCRSIVEHIQKQHRNDNPAQIDITVVSKKNDYSCARYSLRVFKTENHTSLYIPSEREEDIVWLMSITSPTASHIFPPQAKQYAFSLASSDNSSALRIAESPFSSQPESITGILGTNIVDITNADLKHFLQLLQGFADHASKEQ